MPRPIMMSSHPVTSRQRTASATHQISPVATIGSATDGLAGEDVSVSAATAELTLGTSLVPVMVMTKLAERKPCRKRTYAVFSDPANYPAEG